MPPSAIAELEERGGFFGGIEAQPSSGDGISVENRPAIAQFSASARPRLLCGRPVVLCGRTPCVGDWEVQGQR